MTAATQMTEGAPIQYVAGEAAFRHLVLKVNPSVLIPRPETEVLVDLVLSRHKEPGGVVADLGTGSGAIALSLAFEGKFSRVIATDISEAALATARENAASLRDSLKCEVEFRLGSWTDAVAGESLDVLVSNPPYIADGEMAELPSEVADWEPETALASGADGMDATRTIVAGAPAVMKPNGLIVIEVDSRRAGVAADIFRCDTRYDKIEIVPDLTGRSRFVCARRR